MAVLCVTVVIGDGDDILATLPKSKESIGVAMPFLATLPKSKESIGVAMPTARAAGGPRSWVFHRRGKAYRPGPLRSVVMVVTVVTVVVVPLVPAVLSVPGSASTISFFFSSISLFFFSLSIFCCSL